MLEKNNDVKHSAFIDAVASLPDRKIKDGQGRAADVIANKFGVSVSTVYQARSILKHGRTELINALRHGDIPVKTANDAGYTSDINPRFYLENNQLSFDLRVSFPLSKEKI